MSLLCALVVHVRVYNERLLLFAGSTRQGNSALAVNKCSSSSPAFCRPDAHLMHRGVHIYSHTAAFGL
jgi:hypothetical protein